MRAETWKDETRESRGRACAWVVLTALVAAGCQGTIGDTGPGPAGPRRAEEAPPRWERECAQTGDTVGASTLRRITAFEYGNSVRDVLGVSATLATELTPDEHLGPFTANVASDPSLVDIESFLGVAEAVAAATNLETLADCTRPRDEACAARLGREVGRRLWRRPLSDAELDELLSLYALGASFAEGARFMLEAMLQSPHFLYVVEGNATSAGEVETLDGHAVAARLAAFLWRSAPDHALLDAADDGRLSTPEGIRREVERMMADDTRYEQAVRQFHFELLGLFGTDSVPSIYELSKDDSYFPEWNDALAAELREEPAAFVRHLFSVEDAGSLRDLLTARHTYATPGVAALYGLDHPGEGTQRLEFPTDLPRAGLLTQPGVLAVYGKAIQSAPIQRGVLVRERLLCLPIRSPSSTLMVDDPPFDPTISRRKQFEEHGSAVCGVQCHAKIDPIGFAFENFDGLGLWRDEDGGEPVDASGSVPDSDVEGTVAGAVDLAESLAESEMVRDCMMQQWVRFALQREVDDERDACVMERLRTQFEGADLDLRTLITEIAVSELVALRRVD
ncbi:MAG: DUF1592 domain-containing protein [Sandaracinus sp.]|nr:DUF1592 domain-containing protein [Sandaracinus sp.]MCB9636466.1 DUF1592 domain-containing protein [Sandaracinus sp.]